MRDAGCGDCAEHVSECRDLLARLLTVKPKDRITMEELLQHPWIADEGVPLAPFVDPTQHDDVLHSRVVAAMSKFGFSAERVEAAMHAVACDDAYATYRYLESKIRKMGTKRRLLPRTHSESGVPVRGPAETSFTPVKAEEAPPALGCRLHATLASAHSSCSARAATRD